MIGFKTQDVYTDLDAKIRMVRRVVLSAGVAVVVVAVMVFRFLPIPIAVIAFLSFSVLSVVLFEAFFRLFWRFTHSGRPYVMKSWVDLDRFTLEPHPYLPYVYKKNSFLNEIADNKSAARDRKYTFYGVHTNSMRCVNGYDGDREIQVPKPEGLIRISCLGDSTTASYINYQGRHYNYALELERILQERFSAQRVEVNNFGTGGYNSVDLLVRFLLTVYDTKPDIVFIYSAFADLAMAFSPGFDPDFSHYKRNMEGFWRDYQKASRLPRLPLKAYNYLVSFMNSGVMHIQDDTQFISSKSFPDFTKRYVRLDSFERNLEHIIKVCKASGIHVVLSTYVYRIPEVKNIPGFRNYLKEAMNEANEIIRGLADRHGMGLVDNARCFPHDPEHLVDRVHLSHTGTQLFAKNISVPISEFIERKLIMPVPVR